MSFKIASTTHLKNLWKILEKYLQILETSYLVSLVYFICFVLVLVLAADSSDDKEP